MTSSSAAPDVAIDVLGPVRLSCCGSEVDIAARVPRVVLALLAAAGPEGMSTERLIDDVWEGDPPSGGRQTLQSYVSVLRRGLGADAVETLPSGYRLHPDCQVDLWRAQATGALLDLWRGDFATDLRPHRALDVVATSLTEERRLAELTMLGDLVDSAPSQAVARLQEIVEAEPFDGQPVALLMTALARSGRTVDAVRAYQDHRDRLIDETGLEPPAELRELEQRIVAGRETVSLAVDSSPGVAIERPAPPDNTYVPRKSVERAMADALGHQHLISMVGPGGVGKTRLVLEVLREPEFDGRWAYLDVASLEEPTSESLAIVIDELGTLLVEAADSARSRVVVVIDNAEDEVELVRAALTRRHLHGVDVAVLVCSRVRLGAPGEHVIRVEPFRAGDDIDAACDLLAHRIEALGAAADSSDLRRVVEAIDGLPLAIELVAPGVATLGVSATLEDLEAAGQIRATSRDLDERERTVESAIDWSWGRLGGAAQRLGAALSDVVEEFGPDVADVVASAAGDCSRSDLVDLVELSLLRQRVDAVLGPRYQWPTAVRRHVQRAHATDVDRLAIRRALVDACARVCDEVAAATAHLSADEWSVAIGPERALHRRAFLWSRTLEAWPEGVRILAAFMWRHYELADLPRVADWIAACDESTLDIEAKANLATAASCVSMLRGDYSVTAGPTTAALDAAHRSGTVVRVAEALTLRFAASIFEGDIAGAAEMFAETEAACRESDHLWGLAFVHTFMGTAMRRVGDLDSSIERLEEATRISRLVGERRLLAIALSSHGNTLWKLGNEDEAAAMCAEAWTLAQQVGDAGSMALAGIAHGWITHRRGDAHEARVVLEQALDRAIAMGNQTTISSALEWLALLKAEAGEPAVLAMVDGFTEKFRVTPGVGRVDHEAAVERAVDELGEALFDAMRQRGGASQLEDVVALLR